LYDIFIQGGKLSYHRVPKYDHSNCIQECRTIHKKVCDDGSN